MPKMHSVIATVTIDLDVPDSYDEQDIQGITFDLKLENIVPSVDFQPAVDIKVLGYTTQSIELLDDEED